MISTLKYIAAKCTTSVRELHGAFNLVVAYATLTGQPPTLELARQALHDTPTSRLNPSGISPGLILNAVADYFHVTPDSLKAKKREPKLIQARQITIYLLREKTNCPLEDIGRLLGGRDHSTILRGYQKISGLVDSDPVIQNKVTEIIQRLAL